MKLASFILLGCLFSQLSLAGQFIDRSPANARGIRTRAQLNRNVNAREARRVSRGRLAPNRVDKIGHNDTRRHYSRPATRR